jgi:hypothetical protein
VRGRLGAAEPQASLTHLKVAGAEWEGRFRFTAETVARPANDDITDAEAIDALPFLGRTTLAAATFDAGEPDSSCDNNYGAPSVWYTYTPTDVAITGFTTPTTGRVGETKPLVVEVAH